ncbi:MAG TPA: hypothetical protein VGI74_02780 [Streptosporangiaceae bacterium]
MRGERWLLRLGDSLVRAASRRLPSRVRDDRYREWTAELPVILHDPDGGIWPRRAARMLGYALDTIRGTTLASHPARRRGTHRGRAGNPWLDALFSLLSITLVGLYVYFTVTSNNGLGFWVTIWFAGSSGLARYAITRRHRTSRWWATSDLWVPAGGMLVATGNLAVIAAQEAHWRAGRLHAVVLVGYGAEAAGVICLGIAPVAWLWVRRQHRAQRRQPPSSGETRPVS